MMRTETRTINKTWNNVLRFALQERHFLLDLRESVFIRYSLFDLSKNSRLFDERRVFVCSSSG